MAKAQPKKKSNPILWLGGVLVVVVIYTVMSPGDDARPAAKPKAKLTKKAGSDTFTAADLAAADHPFDPLKGPIVNAFKPVIIRSTGGGGLKGDFSSALGGGPGWAYSGMAVVDGVSKGLLENSQTGESVFLTRGEKWENSTVREIYPDHLVLNGPNGPVTVTVEEKDSSTNSPASAGTPVLPAPAAPMNVPLRGDIGAQDPSLSVVPDATVTGTGTGTQRRRRRNAG